MKNTELRIGNIICLIDRIQEVHLPIEMIPYVVSEVGMFHVNLYPLGNHITEVEHIKVDLNDVSPIELTEEWLLKFGFTKIDREDEDFTYFKLNSIEFTDVSPYGYELIGYEQDPCKYVHQLQNLYFALTSEELTLKQINHGS